MLEGFPIIFGRTPEFGHTSAASYRARFVLAGTMR